MLLNVLDSHPELSVYPEDISVLYRYYPQWTDGAKTDEELRARLDHVIFGHLRDTLEGESTAVAERLDIDHFRKEFYARLKGEELNDIGAIISAELGAFRALANPDLPESCFSVAKETSIEIYADELLEAFPNSKFLQLVRDPRDNLAALFSGIESHYHKFGDNEFTILMSLLHRAGLGMRLARSHHDRFGPERYKIIRFEDLVQRPAPVLNDVCDFLGVNFDDVLLRPTILGVRTGGNSFENIAFDGISQFNVGRWRERIPEETAKIIEFHMADIMANHGYEFAFDPAELTSAVADFYKWANYHYFYTDAFA